MKYQLFIITTLISLTLSARLQDSWPIHYNGNILSIFTELQDKLKQGAPVDGISDMLDDIKQHILEEGSRHNDVQEKQKVECTEEVDFRLKEIDEAMIVRDASQTTLNRLDKRYSQLMEELKYAKEELYRDETELEIKINRRRRQKEKSVQKIEDHNSAIVSLNECIEIIEEIYSGGESFIQLASLSKTMLKHAVGLKQTKEYAPMLSVLAQLAIQQDSMLADEQTLIRIKNYIKRIGERIRQQKTQFMEIDQTDEDRYSSEKVRLEGEIEEGKDFIEKTEEEIENVTQLIAEQTSIFEFAIAKIDLNKKLLDDVAKMCETFNKEFDFSVQKRLNEVQLVDQLLQLVENKRSHLNEGIVQKGQQSVDKWDYFEDREAYEATDYENFK